jgi:predicted XRE-type DNA-binding protein
VWDAIEDSPEEAATMTLRSNVMIAISEKVHSWNTTQTAAARRLGITQPRLNDLMHGKINKFSLGGTVFRLFGFSCAPLRRFSSRGPC